MKTLLKLEEAAMFGISLLALVQYDPAWWWYALLLLGPDISMLGYLAGNRTGAELYNFFHHKGIAILVFIMGIYSGMTWLEMSGLLLFGHSSMDRMLGYGLKTYEGFKHTHLGIIGKKQP